MEPTEEEKENKEGNDDDEKKYFLSGRNSFRRFGSYRLSKRRLSTITIGNSQRRLSTYGLASLPNHYLFGSLNLEIREEKKMKAIDWIRNWEFYLVGLCYLSSRVMYLPVLAYTVYYVEFTLLLEKSFKAVVPLVMFLSGFTAAAAVQVARRYFSLRIIFLVSCTLGLGKYDKCGID